LFSNKAFKFLEGLDATTRNRVMADIDGLRNFPFFDSSLDVAKLRGEKDYYRLRTGKIRTIFNVDKSGEIILVRKVAYREQAYE
jgi:mRNA-degrading endonuclease RelE of RelBE toxin-antitoxin system